MSTFSKPFFLVKSVFLGSEYEYNARSSYIARYQDKVGLYQKRENYNFRNFIKNFYKKANNRQKLIMNLPGNIFAAKFSHSVFNET